MRLTSRTLASASILVACLVSSTLDATAEPASVGRMARSTNADSSTTTRDKAIGVDALDWPSWRGPEQNGISRETGLVDKWNPDGGDHSNLRWSSEELAGISTPIVMRGKLYTIVRDQPGTTREQEKVVCVDAATGKKIWENGHNVFLSDVPAERVGWSNCVGDPKTGRVYALGVCGLFQCLDGESGQTVWQHSLSEEFGLLTTYGGRTNTPVLFDDLAIISGVVTSWGDMARPAHRFLAFKKDTGEMVWFNGTRLLPEDTTYCTPVLTLLNGQAAMVFGSGDGAVWAFQPRTGKPIWQFSLSGRGINDSPVVDDNKVYIGHAEENAINPKTMGAVVAIDGSKTGDVTNTAELWRAAGAMIGKSSPLLVDGRLYAIDDGGKMYVLDAATGHEICKPIKLIGTIMRGSPVYGDGKIYVCTTGAWHVFQPTKDGVKAVHKMRLAPEDEVSGSPIISHGCIYLPTGAHLFCIGDRDAQPQATSHPSAPEERPAAKDDAPATVQVTPVEALLKPDQKQKFSVRLFNDRGEYLPDGTAQFTLDGPGEMNRDGEFTAPHTPSHTATIVTAKVGDLSGKARIRIVPNLPWTFDFNDGEVPITWVGARYRHQIRDMGVDKVLVKVTTIPKGTRSQAWMGPTDLHDYTIQADVRGALVPRVVPQGSASASPNTGTSQRKGDALSQNGKMPDVGLIAQRYTLDLMGASQQLQIRSWTSVLGRFSKTVAYEWKPNSWYTLKFRAALENGKAVLKGKVWPRDEREPGAWTIEAVDDVPNSNGSPGLFGNANDAEIYLDNVRVYPNGALDSKPAPPHVSWHRAPRLIGATSPARSIRYSENSDAASYPGK